MSKKKLKIAIFHLAFIYSGGGERLVLEEAIGLSKKGHDVTIFTPIIDEKNCFPELLSQVKIKRLFPKVPLWFFDIELISILFSCVFTPFSFFRFKKFDIYFGANQPGPWISYALSKINKVPYVIYLAQPTRLIHPRLIDQKIGLRITDGFTMLRMLTIFFKPVVNILDILSVKNAKVIFANGSYAEGLLEEAYRINAINCPAGTHLKNKMTKKDLKLRFKGKIKLNGKKIKKPYLLLTNRHFSQKKFEYAIEAVNCLKNKPDIVITGKETDYTEVLKKKYKNNKNIHFLGLLSEKELNFVYKNSAVYVYSAPEEDFGMGIVEAMSYGVPVVAWGNAGPTGIIEHAKDGLLAKPFSIDDFAFNIERLFKDRNLYKKISNAAFKKVKENFSYKIHNEILEGTLKLLVENKLCKV